MSEQQFRLIVGRSLNQRSSTFWSPSPITARNMAQQEPQGRPFTVDAICPTCDLVVSPEEPHGVGPDGRVYHSACWHKEWPV